MANDIGRLAEFILASMPAGDDNDHESKQLDLHQNHAHDVIIDASSISESRRTEGLSQQSSCEVREQLEGKISKSCIDPPCKTTSNLSNGLGVEHDPAKIIQDIIDDIGGIKTGTEAADDLLKVADSVAGLKDRLVLKDGDSPIQYGNDSVKSPSIHPDGISIVSRSSNRSNSSRRSNRSNFSRRSDRSTRSRRHSIGGATRWAGKAAFVPRRTRRPERPPSVLQIPRHPADRNSTKLLHEEVNDDDMLDPDKDLIEVDGEADDENRVPVSEGTSRTEAETTPLKIADPPARLGEPVSPLCKNGRRIFIMPLSKGKQHTNYGGDTSSTDNGFSSDDGHLWSETQSNEDTAIWSSDDGMYSFRDDTYSREDCLTADTLSVGAPGCMLAGGSCDNLPEIQQPPEARRTESPVPSIPPPTTIDVITSITLPRQCEASDQLLNSTLHCRSSPVLHPADINERVSPQASCGQLNLLDAATDQPTGEAEPTPHRTEGEVVPKGSVTEVAEGPGNAFRQKIEESENIPRTIAFQPTSLFGSPVGPRKKATKTKRRASLRCRETNKVSLPQDHIGASHRSMRQSSFGYGRSNEQLQSGRAERRHSSPHWVASTTAVTNVRPPSSIVVVHSSSSQATRSHTRESGRRSSFLASSRQRNQHYQQSRHPRCSASGWSGRSSGERDRYGRRTVRQSASRIASSRARSTGIPEYIECDPARDCVSPYSDKDQMALDLKERRARLEFEANPNHAACSPRSYKLSTRRINRRMTAPHS